MGVPGSVGGAVRMNAGGHGSDTAATLVDYRLGRPGHRIGRRRRRPSELASGYRHTALAPAPRWWWRARSALEPGEPAEGEAAIAEIVRWRRANQPGGSNAGSVFTNPPGDSAGRLIDACGLKGFRIGTAEVSTKHANFIQADPGGSADDVLPAHRPRAGRRWPRPPASSCAPRSGWSGSPMPTPGTALDEPVPRRPRPGPAPDHRSPHPPAAAGHPAQPGAATAPVDRGRGGGRGPGGGGCRPGPHPVVRRPGRHA